MNEELQSFFCAKASERIGKIITSRKLSFLKFILKTQISFHGLYRVEEPKEIHTCLLIQQFKELMKL